MSARVLALCLVPLLAAACTDSPSQPELATQTDLSPLRALHVPVSGTIVVGADIDRGLWFTTGKGVVHIRNYEFNVSLDGDLEGDGIFKQNANWTPEGNGGVSGPVKSTVTWNGKTGAMSGQFAGGLSEYVLDASFTFHGSGELKGVKWVGTLYGPLGGPYEYGGRLVIPSGM